MDDGEIAAPAQVFIRHLVALWDVVGRPSPRRLEERSRKRHGGRNERIKRSTADDYFRGKRRKVPPWPMVLELLQICREIAENDGYCDPELLGADKEWQDAWRTARLGLITESPVRFPQQLPPVAQPLADVGSRPVPIPPEGEAPSEQDHQGTVSRADPEPQALDGDRRAPVSDMPASPDPPSFRPDSQPASSAVGADRPYVFHAPELGEEGGWMTVIKWCHRVGDHVGRDEVLVHLRTDMDFPLKPTSPRDGVLSEIFVQEKEEVAAGHPLCAIAPD